MAEQDLEPGAEQYSGARIARALVRHHWLFFIAAIALIVLGGLGITHVHRSTDTRAFFGPENPEYKMLLQIEDMFVSSDNMIIVISGPEGSDFDPQTLEAVRTATEDAWYVPHVLRVDSLATFNHSWADGDDIIVEPLIPEDGEITPEIAAQARERAFSSEELVNRIVSPDGRTFGIAISIITPDRSNATFQEIMDSVDAIADKIRTEYPGHEVYLTGTVMASLAFSEAAGRDLDDTLPMAALSTVVLLVRGLGTFSGVVGSVIVLLGGAAITLGAGGWLGMALTPGNAPSPLAVIVIVAATCMHLVLHWRNALGQGMSNYEAVEHSVEENLAPITVTNLTTAFGFLCLNFSDAPPLRDLGNMIALGTVAGWLLSVMVLPTTLLMLPALRRRREGLLPRVLRWVGTQTLSHRKSVLVLFAILTGISIFGIMRIQFNDDFIRYFDHSYRLRRDADVIEDRLTSLKTVSFVLKSPYEGGIFAPEFLDQLDQFEKWLDERPDVLHAAAINQPLKRLNMNLNGDDPAFYKTADSSAANAQLLMLYELNLPVGQDLNTQISIDRKQTLMSVSLDVESSAELRWFTADAEKWMAENTPDIATIGTGASVTFARISQRNGTAMFSGAIVALIVISGAMIVALRSWRYGFLSLVPNLVPALMAFGIWGVVFRDVNLGSTVVTVMTFGIVVDDTVHMMMTYIRQRRLGYSPEEAVRRMLATVGTAVTLTSVTLVVGFSIIGLSSFAINEHLGALTALVVAMAYLADLILLPVLLVTAEGKRK
ncbi:MAG: hypothetical protein CML66_04005 [Rhodobacteraceae bacterium]|nr:hypothetical protein [Paracoccaceae bacterium]